MLKTTTNREEARVLHLLGILMKSGVPLIKAIEPVIKTHPNFKYPLEVILDHLKKGRDVAEPMSVLDAYFSGFVKHIIKYGSIGGNLDNVFLEASHMLDSTEKMIEANPNKFKINEVNYYRLLGSIVGNDCPIIEAMNIVGALYLPSDEVRKSVIKPLMKGGMISDGLRAHPELFSAVGCSFMNAGEQTGAFPEVCRSFADLLEQQIMFYSHSSEADPAKKIAQAEEMIEYGHLSFLMNFGVPIERMLVIVSEASAIPDRKEALKALSEKVKSGITLGAAMESIPRHFSQWVTMIIQKYGNTPEELYKALQYVLKNMC